MAFYRRRTTYADYAPHIQEVRQTLRQRFPVEPEADPALGEAFLVDFPNHIAPASDTKLVNTIFNLTNAGYIKQAPFGKDGWPMILYITEKADGPKPTVSRFHIRLPKLSYLITLVPEDFFLLFRIIANAKVTSTNDSLTLNFPAAGVDDLSGSPLQPFFMPLITNYRMNQEFCDKKWTSYEVIKFIAAIEPTRDNQLSAMQYLTAMQNPDLLYFPVETSVELELDWEQTTDDYCVPPEPTNN